ncbi:hypothetical protein [Paenibacillus sp. GYB003]|uniref:hypothetical protein n=1 Tax=Paenibacillus sp. GYB003 TaxID=2994392 RepID=UPI002F9672DA
MKSLLLKITLYSAACLLCIWYVTVLYLSQRPNVSTEYYMHYIAKTLVDWPGNGGLQYQIGTKLFMGSRATTNEITPAKNRGRGWLAQEYDGQWADNDAQLFFIINQSAFTHDLRLVVDATIKGTTRKVNVLINGMMVGQINSNGSKNTYEINIPYTVINKFPIVCVEFKINDEVVDPELLIHWVSISASRGPNNGSIL